MFERSRRRLASRLEDVSRAFQTRRRRLGGASLRGVFGDGVDDRLPTRDSAFCFLHHRLFARHLRESVEAGLFGASGAEDADVADLFHFYALFRRRRCFRWFSRMRFRSRSGFGF